MSDARRFTLEDVAIRNGTGDAGTWIVIRNIVYDVTNYAKQHPGGSELLMEYAGKDGTSAFDNFGHSSDATNTLKSYKIGELDEIDRTADRNKRNKIKNQNFGSDVDTPRRQNRRSFLRKVCGGCV